MASEELLNEAKELGETPILNTGLDDQRIALQWVQANIDKFGGDSSRVTLAGQSAGGLSVLCHLQAGKPLFHQALIESTPAPRLRTLKESQCIFDKLVEKTGVSNTASGTEKLAALRALTSQQLVDSFDGGIFMPLEDPAWFNTNKNRQNKLDLPWGKVPSWCDRVTIGYTKDEPALILTALKNAPFEMALEMTQSMVPHVEIPDHLQRPGDHVAQELIKWSSDQNFVISAFELASTMADQDTQVFFYRMDFPDPFPGPLYGSTWHSFGLPLIFYLPPGRIYPQFAAVQDRFSVALMNYLYGQEPWATFNRTREIFSWDEISHVV